MWIHATYVVLINKIISVDVLPNDEKVWDAGTPIGQSKDANNHIVYNGRMTAPQDQTATDEDHWSKASDGTEDTEADTINDPADYVWTGATFVTGPKREDGTYPTAVKVTGMTATLLAPQSGSVAPTCTISNTHGEAPDSRRDEAITRSVEVKILIVKVDATSDHLDADGTSQSKIRIRLVDKDNNPVALPGLAMTLKAEFPAPAQGAAAPPSPGTFRDAQLISDGNGQGFADKNDNGQRDAGEDDFTLFKTGKTGGWATVTATVSQSKDTKELLLHRVDVKDFAQPKLLINKDNSSGGPSLDFSINQAPSVCQLFKVTTTIYSLSGHDPVAQKVEVLPPGAHSYAWSDFFTHDSSDGSGKPLDLGEGIYPFQVEAVALPVDKGGLDKSQLDAHSIADQTPKACDWKASKTLKVKPVTSNGTAISYDEDTGKTFLTYLFDISSSAAVPVAPVNVHVDVYGPDYEKLATVLPMTAPHISDDGRTFSFWTRGEVTLPSAGDYHFVIEAQQPDVNSQGKDVGKWAMEQNARFVSPPFVVFGAKNPGKNRAGVPGNLDTRDVATYAGNVLNSMGYGTAGSVPSPNKWWTPDNSGVIHDTDADTAFGPANATSLPVGPLTAQYNAVWMFIGHGSTVNSGNRGQKVFFQPDGSEDIDPNPESDGQGSAIYSSSTAVPLAPSSNRRFLNQLPPVYQALSRRPATTLGSQTLFNSRLMFFAGCWTADHTKSIDLPRAAVASGARTAIGLEGALYLNELDDTVRRFIADTKDGYTVQEAADDVQSMYQSWGIMGGSGLDKDSSHFRINAHGATSIKLRSVVDNGILVSPRYRYMRNAKWGWE